MKEFAPMAVGAGEGVGIFRLRDGIRSEPHRFAQDDRGDWTADGGAPCCICGAAGSGGQECPPHMVIATHNHYHAMALF